MDFWKSSILLPRRCITVNYRFSPNWYWTFADDKTRNREKKNCFFFSNKTAIITRTIVNTNTIINVYLSFKRDRLDLSFLQIIILKTEATMSTNGSATVRIVQNCLRKMKIIQSDHQDPDLMYWMGGIRDFSGGNRTRRLNESNRSVPESVRILVFKKKKKNHIQLIPAYFFITRSDFFSVVLQIVIISHRSVRLQCALSRTFRFLVKNFI